MLFAGYAAICSLTSFVKRDFGTNLASVSNVARCIYAGLLTTVQIPPHGRWRHLDAGRPRVEPLIAKWKASVDPPSEKEIARRLLDLFLVSVLLDAGAGNAWLYHEESTKQSFSRSEGLGVASFVMFEEGLFSGNSANPYQADGEFKSVFLC